jgi:hypothetical protein
VQVGNGNNILTVLGTGGASVQAGTGQNVIVLLTAQYTYASVKGVSLIVGGLGARGINLNGTNSIVATGTVTTTSTATLQSDLFTYYSTLNGTGHVAAKTYITGALIVQTYNTNASNYNFQINSAGPYDVDII